MSNPNFPTRHTGREIPSTHGTTGAPIMPTVQTAGMTPMGMGGMGQMPGMGKQQSPLEIIQAQLRSGQLKNNFSYEERKSQTNLDYSCVEAFMNGEGDGQTQDDLMKLRMEEAKNMVAPIIMMIAQEFSLRQGRFKALEIVMRNFAGKFTGGVGVKTVEKYWHMVGTNSQVRMAIGTNVGVLFAHQMASGIIQDAAPNPAQSEKLFHGCIDNVLAMELSRWLTQNPGARAMLQEDGLLGVQFRKGLMNQLNARQGAISESYAFMGIECPYDGFEPKFEESLDRHSDPSSYILGQHHYAAPAPYGQYVPEQPRGQQQQQQAPSSVTDMLFALNAKTAENQAMANAQSGGIDYSSYADQTVNNVQEQYYEEPEEAIVYGQSSNMYTDFDRMTAENARNFDWHSQLVEIPGTGMYTAPNHIVRALNRAFFGGSARWMRSYPYHLTVFTLNAEGYPNRDDRVISLRGRSVETFLTNPNLLLPLLEDTPNGVMEVRQVEVTVDENEQYNLKAVREAACESDDVRNTLLPEVAYTNIESYDQEANLVHKAGRRDGIPHATTNIEVHHESVVMESTTQVSEVYRGLSMLNKNNSQNMSYFDFIRKVYNVISNQFLEEGPLVMKIDQYLSNELERHMIERYGFDNNPNSDFYFKVHTLTDCFDDISDVIYQRCPEAHQELSNSYTAQTLIAKSQCFIERAEALKILLNDIRPNSRMRAVEEYDASMRVLFVREVVVTRISNMSPPVDTAADSISVIKRSEFPDLFKLIAIAYSGASRKLLNGPEQFVVFTDASDTRWSFQSNRYDRGNVATLRRLAHNNNATMMDLMPTH